MFKYTFNNIYIYIPLSATDLLDTLNFNGGSQCAGLLTFVSHCSDNNSLTSHSIGHQSLKYLSREIGS